jgi:hypothetical protein
MRGRLICLQSLRGISLWRIRVTTKLKALCALLYAVAMGELEAVPKRTHLGKTLDFCGAGGFTDQPQI